MLLRENFCRNAVAVHDWSAEIACWIEHHLPPGSERPPAQNSALFGEFQVLQERLDDLREDLLSPYNV